jgi:heme-degrading monooxygenase HmoA
MLLATPCLESLAHDSGACPVHAVVFQFRPHADQRDAYFALVAQLRPELQRIDGFLENERFASVADPSWLLSLSLWRDEAAILRWRQHALHRVAQVRGKREVFAGYRLRVCEVIEAGGAEELRLAIGRDLVPARDGEPFDSITEPGRRLVLGGTQPPACGEVERRLGLRIVRDYGFGERPPAVRS